MDKVYICTYCKENQLKSVGELAWSKCTSCMNKQLRESRANGQTKGIAKPKEELTMGRYVNRAGLSKTRIGGARRSHHSYSSAPSVQQVEQTKVELGKVELFTACIKLTIMLDNSVDYRVLVNKVQSVTDKNDSEAMHYVQQLYDMGYFEKNMRIVNGEGLIAHLSVTKKACDKIRSFNATK